MLSRHVAVFTAVARESGPSFQTANASIAKWANGNEEQERLWYKREFTNLPLDTVRKSTRTSVLYETS